MSIKEKDGRWFIVAADGTEMCRCRDKQDAEEILDPRKRVVHEPKPQTRKEAQNEWLRGM